MGRLTTWKCLSSLRFHCDAQVEERVTTTVTEKNFHCEFTLNVWDAFTLVFLKINSCDVGGAGSRTRLFSAEC